MSSWQMKRGANGQLTYAVPSIAFGDGMNRFFIFGSVLLTLYCVEELTCQDAQELVCEK